MDSRHRILSTRGCVSPSPKNIVSFWWTLLFFTHWLNFTSALQHTDTSSVSGCRLIAHDTKKRKKKSLPQEKQYTHTHTNTHSHSFSHDNLSLWTANPYKGTWKAQKTSTMSTTACVSAQTGCPVGRRQLRAPWTGLALQGSYCRSVLYSKNGWHHDPRDLIRCIQNYCGTRGNNCTVHCPCLCSVSGLLIIVIATAVCRFVCFWEVNVLWIVWVFLLRNVCANMLLGFLFCFPVSVRHLWVFFFFFTKRGKKKAIWNYFTELSRKKIACCAKYLCDKLILQACYAPKAVLCYDPPITSASLKPYDEQ